MEEDADARVDVDAVVDARTRARVVMTRASGRVEAPAAFREARRGRGEGAGGYALDRFTGETRG